MNFDENGDLIDSILNMNIMKNIEEVQDIGQIQPNSLINADCLEAMKYIESKSIDMILCDLPYG